MVEYDSLQNKLFYQHQYGLHHIKTTIPIICPSWDVHYMMSTLQHDAINILVHYIFFESWYMQDSLRCQLHRYSLDHRRLPVTLVVSMEHGLCQKCIHNTKWPNTIIGMKKKSRLDTRPRMSCTSEVYLCSCTQSGSIMVNCSDTSWDNEYSINMVNNVMTHVDAISPSLHIIWRSDYATSMMRLSFWHASWYLFQRRNAIWIEPQLHLEANKS